MCDFVYERQCITVCVCIIRDMDDNEDDGDDNIVYGMTIYLYHH